MFVPYHVSVIEVTENGVRKGSGGSGDGCGDGCDGRGEVGKWGRGEGVKGRRRDGVTMYPDGLGLRHEGRPQMIHG
jgi:hypothetical protein